MHIEIDIKAPKVVLTIWAFNRQNIRHIHVLYFNDLTILEDHFYNGNRKKITRSTVVPWFQMIASVLI